MTERPDDLEELAAELIKRVWFECGGELARLIRELERLRRTFYDPTQRVQLSRDAVDRETNVP